jgi:hypothetical protein
MAPARVTVFSPEDDRAAQPLLDIVKKTRDSK